jgi:hypothetical protein
MAASGQIQPAFQLPNAVLPDLQQTAPDVKFAVVTTQPEMMHGPSTFHVKTRNVVSRLGQDALP